MEGLGQYLKLSDAARIIITHTYKMNEKGEKVTKFKLENRFGEGITEECLKEIFHQHRPLLEIEKNRFYTVSPYLKPYFHLL